MTDRKFVDLTTGQVYDMQQYYLRSRNQDDAFRRKSLSQDRRHFSFADMDGIREVIASVSTVHCGYLLILQCYMEFGTGKLQITRKQMPRTVGTSESTFARFWTVMKQYGIVEERADGYYVNPRYHFRQQSTSDRVIKLFTTTILQLKEVHRLKASELGFLYKLLPYVHYDTNMICADPFVEAPEQIQFLNAVAIARLLEMDEEMTRRSLDKLRRAGVVAETIRKDDRRDRLFTLNPYVFYRKSGIPERSLRSLFDAQRYQE